MPEGEIKEVNADKLGAQQRIASVGDEHECFLSKFKDLVHRWKRKIYEVSEAGSIYVRVYEDMIDLLRVAIVGPSGTPYHDSLFFFDVRFPPEYPRCPPEGPKCGYVEWVDPEWPPQLKTTLDRMWDMYEDENKTRLSDNLANAEGIFKVLKEKEKMEKDLRFFKLDFAKMVADKEQALAQLGNTQIALSDLKEELEKKKISDKSATNIHQVFRAKAEKELELIKQELELMNQERGKTMKERDEVMQERDELKKEKKKLEYMIGDLFKHKEETKSKIRKVREILDEFE
ncbi:putative CBL-interacting protein kinase 13 [Hordeum vulgare]|nr:putative CBL-interacting protein kinase 13 [Hordeum vulgare]